MSRCIFVSLKGELIAGCEQGKVSGLDQVKQVNGGTGAPCPSAGKVANELQVALHNAHLCSAFFLVAEPSTTAQADTFCLLLVLLIREPRALSEQLIAVLCIRRTQDRCIDLNTGRYHCTPPAG